MKLGELADLLGGDLFGDAALTLSGMAPLEEAQSSDLSLCAELSYDKAAEASNAGAILSYKKLDTVANQIVVANPRALLKKAILAFYPNAEEHQAAIHPTAVIADTATLGQSVSIGANVVVGDHVQIGDHTVIFPNVTLYDGVIIGAYCRLHAGVVVGSDGFGFQMQDGAWDKIPHIGTVVIEDHVELFANTTVARGCLGETRIKEGAKVDNLVHIAHNVKVGKHTALAAQVGTLGRAVIGDYVQIAGQVGVAAVEIGDQSVVLAKAGVTKDLPGKGLYSGYPAWPHAKELKAQAKYRKLAK